MKIFKKNYLQRYLSSPSAGKRLIGSVVNFASLLMANNGTSGPILFGDVLGVGDIIGRDPFKCCFVFCVRLPLRVDIEEVLRCCPKPRPPSRANTWRTQQMRSNSSTRVPIEPSQRCCQIENGFICFHDISCFKTKRKEKRNNIEIGR